MAEGGERGGRPTVAEARAWTGHRLDEMTGQSVGRIDGIFVDEAGGEPEWLLVRLGRFAHHTVVPARDAVTGVDHVWVPYGRDRIRSAPKIDPKATLTAAAERALLELYGIPADAGRAAELRDSDDDAISARPA
jgi:hypothetical protein